jgi:small-conductance mechanosensitive channel
MRRDVIWLAIRILLLLFAQWLVGTIYATGLLDFLGTGNIQTLVHDVLQNLLLTLFIWFIFALYKRYVISGATSLVSSAIVRFVRKPAAQKRAYKSICRYLTYFGYFFLAIALLAIWTYSYIGTWLAGTLGTSLVLMLTFIFGLFTSSVLGNLLAFWVLTNTVEFTEGDRVQIGDTYGDVIELGYFFTRIKTIKDEIISIPNLLVMAKEIQNFSTLEAVLVYIPVTLTYGVNEDQAKQLLIQCAEATEGILIDNDQKPFVLFRDLGKYTVTFEINAYTNRPNQLVEVKSQLIENILREFRKAKIELLSPAFIALREDPSR